MERILEKIGFGSFADIYALPEGRVLKAYRRKSHVNRVVRIGDDHDLLTAAHFEAEVRAYEWLQSIKELEKYLPCYFGRADPVEFLQLDPTDVRYVRNCGIVLELIPGRAEKVAHLEQTIQKEVEAVLKMLSEALPEVNVWDASCFVPGTRAKFALIDFALFESFEYETYLHDSDCLSPKLRDKLRNAHADKQNDQEGR